MSSSLEKINLGCGGRYHPDWVNVDFTSANNAVIAADLGDGIPFPDKSFDVVYHSHLLEHFPKGKAMWFLSECRRVMKPGGILRVAVPDLEMIVREYLLALEQAYKGRACTAENYEWMLLEMYDQVVRHKPGGEMATYLFSESIANESFVVGRCGVEAKYLIEAGRRKRKSNALRKENAESSTMMKLARFFRHPKEHLLRYLLQDEYAALQLGRFRRSGEIHQWMYDTYSLGRLLAECGFVDVLRRKCDESYVANWAEFNLDTEPDGTVYKPDSLFMEARNP